MNRRFVRFNLLLAVVLLSALSVAQDRRLSPEKIELIEKAITTEMARQNIPGLAVAVVLDNTLQWSNGYGFSDLENFVPAKATTVYRLGSISKPITAVAAMQLVERGKLDLDAPVQKYVPSFPQKPWPITARLLLSHMSGIRHYKGEEISITRHYDNLVEGLRIFQDDALLFEPGTRYSYSTYAYNLLGCVIEGASGLRYPDYVRENIFKPAGMDRIRVNDLFEIIPNHAQGYRKTASGELRNSGLADTSYKIPGGGFCSTVGDLAKFAIAVQKGTLLNRESLRQMWTRQKTRGDEAVDYGLGFAVTEKNGRLWVGHGGGQQRITTFLSMIPERNAAAVVMTNLEGASDLPNFSYRLLEIALN